MSRPFTIVPSPRISPAAASPLASVPLTPLIGRRRERAALTHLLGSTRLLTLTGPGGCGKTRLALALSETVAPAFPHGVGVAELAALADPAFIPHTVAAALGMREQPGRPLLDTLVAVIAPRTCLLVLDNCEHLIGACAELAAHVLRSCPHLTLLATSREPLQVAGETTWQVPSLSLPGTGDTSLPEALLTSEAAQLFVERARARQPGLTITRENAAAVAAICLRLDGMPLALELAAARVGAMPLTEIPAHLDNALELLIVGNRAALPRQRTLRGTLDWSHALLDAKERAVFRRLAVFAGGCTPAAAEAVCGEADIAPERVLLVLAQLVDKSLVALHGDGDNARYHLLEVVRQYALEQLMEADETAIVRERHADHYRALTDAAKVALNGADQATWLARLETELGNIRAALEWSRAQGSIERGLLIAANLFRFWAYRSHLTEGGEWLALFLAAGEAEVAIEARLDALFVAGRLAIFQSNHDAARLPLRQMLALAKTHARPLSIAMASCLLGHCSLEQCAYLEARDLYIEAEEHARIAADRYAIALTVGSQGIATVMLGDNARAEALLIKAQHLYGALGDMAEITRIHRWLGVLAIERGDTDHARESLEACLEGHRQLDALIGIAEGLEALAALAVAERRLARALTIAGAAEAIRETIGARMPPHWHTWLTPRLDAARNMLGAATSAEMWSRGMAMTVEEAMATAIATEPLAPLAARSSNGASARRRDQKRWYGGLTAREREVAGLTVGDRTNREIAEALFVTEKTVEAHISSALRKLGFDSRAKLARWAVAVGLTDAGVEQRAD